VAQPLDVSHLRALLGSLAFVGHGRAERSRSASIDQRSRGGRSVRAKGGRESQAIAHLQRSAASTAWQVKDLTRKNSIDSNWAFSKNSH
jgi:hypothetical protein